MNEDEDYYDEDLGVSGSSAKGSLVCLPLPPCSAQTLSFLCPPLAIPTGWRRRQWELQAGRPREVSPAIGQERKGHLQVLCGRQVHLGKDRWRLTRLCC